MAELPSGGQASRHAQRVTVRARNCGALGERDGGALGGRDGGTGGRREGGEGAGGKAAQGAGGKAAKGAGGREAARLVSDLVKDSLDALELHEVAHGGGGTVCVDVVYLFLAADLKPYHI